VFDSCHGRAQSAWRADIEWKVVCAKHSIVYIVISYSQKYSMFKEDFEIKT
jgi:hypothetical protein